MFYVYLHITKDTNEIFYVGKGKGNRAYKSSGRNKFWHSVINKHGFKVEIVKENLTEEQSVALEKQLIHEYGRRDLGVGKLVNLTNGGDGVSGKIYTDNEKKLLSDSLKSHYKISENREKRRQVAKKVLGRKEVREKLRIAALKINSSEEFKKNKTKNTRNSWNNPKTRQLRIEKIKQARNTPQSKNKTILKAQKTYAGFISPAGKIYSPVINLTNFCKEHNLSRSGMYGVNSGKLLHHKGWYLYKPDKEIVGA